MPWLRRASIEETLLVRRRAGILEGKVLMTFQVGDRVMGIRALVGCKGIVSEVMDLDLAECFMVTWDDGEIWIVDGSNLSLIGNQ